MEKKYQITKTKNGFIIEFNHESLSFKDENKSVALTLAAVIRVINDDIRKTEKKVNGVPDESPDTSTMES